FGRAGKAASPGRAHQHRCRRPPRRRGWRCADGYPGQWRSTPDGLLQRAIASFPAPARLLASARQGRAFRAPIELIGVDYTHSQDSFVDSDTRAIARVNAVVV